MAIPDRQWLILIRMATTRLLWEISVGSFATSRILDQQPIPNLVTKTCCWQATNLLKCRFTDLSDPVPEFVDFNNDGHLDLISGSYDPGEVYLFRGIGDNRFSAR